VREGLRTSYVVSGPETAPTLVFVHGLASSKATWTDLVTRLQPAFRTLVYDLRGHGESDRVDFPCSRSDLAGDLRALLDVLAIDRAVLVGHSAGGVIAMQFLADHPGRVAGLVLLGTASECNAKTAAWYETTAEQARTEGGGAAMRAMGVKATGVPVPDGTTFSHVALAMRSLHGDPLTEAMRRVRCPALVIVGEKDFLGVGGSVILSRAIEGAALEIRSGVGHAVHIEEPDWLASRIARFVEDRVVA
jgi:pimeloyl-ACP methyl ester carboxylesterase